VNIELTANSIWLCRKRKALKVVTKRKRKMVRRKCHQQQQLPQQVLALVPRMRLTMKRKR